MPVINVENAQIKTAAIEIKALTVSGKQVTQSVFKQLQDDCCIDFDSVTLKGLVWGHVNFKVDKFDLNFIWQSGKELKRSILPKHIRHFKGEEDDYHFENKLRELFEKDMSVYSKLGIIKSRLEYGSDYASDELYKESLDRINSKVKCIWLTEEEKAIYEKHFIERNGKLLEAKENIINHIKTINDKIDKYNKLLESLSAVPQLFIAV